MNDDPGEDLLESMNEPPRREPPTVPQDPALPGGRDGRDDLDAAFASGGAAAAGAAARTPPSRHKILGERDPSAGSRHGGDADPSDISGRARAAITIGASFGIVMLAAALMARPDVGPSQVGQQSAFGAEDSDASRPKTAEEKKAEAEAKRFVTASLLNCRSSPDEEAKPVRRLRRGETVQVLAMEPSWASVSHKGRQCWASTRYISEYKPL